VCRFAVSAKHVGLRTQVSDDLRRGKIARANQLIPIGAAVVVIANVDDRSFRSGLQRLLAFFRECEQRDHECDRERCRDRQSDPSRLFARLFARLFVEERIA